MSDRELLELAAKAAGIEFNGKRSSTGGIALYCAVNGWWNPLQDDRDALRLAVKLRISIYFHEDNSVSVSYLTGKGTVRCWTECFNADNAEELVRRAITSLAAEIGKEMK